MSEEKERKALPPVEAEYKGEAEVGDLRSIKQYEIDSHALAESRSPEENQAAADSLENKVSRAYEYIEKQNAAKEQKSPDPSKEQQSDAPQQALESNTETQINNAEQLAQTEPNQENTFDKPSKQRDTEREEKPEEQTHALERE